MTTFASSMTWTRIGALPPEEGPRPISSTRPSLMASPTSSPTLVRVSSVTRAMSARLIGPQVVDRAQHEALVDRAGLLVGRLRCQPHPR